MTKLLQQQKFAPIGKHRRDGLHAWLAFSVASLFFLYEFVSRIEPSLAAGGISDFFGLSNTAYGTLSSIFFWVYAPMQLVVGLMLDRFGARRTVVPAIFICAMGVLLFSSTANLALAATGRALTGLGASFAFVGALYVVNHRFAPEKFAVLSGVVNAIAMLGTAIGAVAISPFIASSGWQHVFQITSAVGLSLFIFGLLFLRDIAAPSARPESILQPLQAIIRDHRIWLIAIVGALIYMPVNVFGGLWGQSELMRDHGLTNVEAETAVSLIFWGMAAGSIASGALSDWLGHRKWLVIGGAICTTAAYILAIIGNEKSFEMISFFLFLGGFFGGVQMLTFAMAKEGQTASNSGAIIAFVNMIGIGGALVFQPLFGYLVDINQGNFDSAVAAIPICTLAAGVIALFLREYRNVEHISPPEAQ